MSQNWQALSWLTWINKPSTATPINQTNLNANIKSNGTELDTRTRTLDTIKLDITDANSLVQSVTFDSTTGIFTITKYNGSSTTIDTKLEKIAINFYYDNDPTSPHYQDLVIELEDGTYQYIDMSTLITEYEFDNSTTIGFTVTSGVVSAEVLDGSITASKLEPNYLAQCLAAVADAQAAETSAQKWADGTGAASGDPQYENNAKYYSDSADASRLESEGWALGTQDGVPVTSGPYYHNNAKYYKDEARAIAGGSIGGLSDVTISSPQDGQALIYDSNDQMWENKDISNSLADLTDTTITSPIVGDLLMWDGTKWVNEQIYPDQSDFGTLIAPLSSENDYILFTEDGKAIMAEHKLF